MIGFDEFIKGEDSSFGSQDYLKHKNYTSDRDIVNHCVTTFYDQDSNEEIIQAKCSAHEVICYLEHTLNICDTPLVEILETVAANQMFKGVDLDLLKRKIIKKKNELKRARAKNRKLLVRQHKANNISVAQECEEEEFKKQRNRISAQISRDRKKEKMKALQELNRQLEEECKQQKAENQRLRREAEQRGQVPSNDRKVQPKNKFTFMLVFLGLFFLFGLIKEMFQGSESTKAIAKIHQIATTAMAQDKELSYYSKPEYQPLILEQIQSTLTETIENKSIAQRIKQKIRERMSWFQSKQSSTMVAQPLVKKEYQL